MYEKRPELNPLELTPSLWFAAGKNSLRPRHNTAMRIIETKAMKGLSTANGAMQDVTPQMVAAKQT